MEGDRMIDLATHRVVKLAHATKFVPQLRDKPVHPSTLFRWATHGVRADDGTIVRLETIRVGRTLCTSAEAIQAFCQRLSVTEAAPALSLRRSSGRGRSAERVERELDRRGL
jgi:hypothetical protein